MKRKILTLSLFFLFLGFCRGQTREQMCQQVLAKNLIGQKIKFDQSTRKDGHLVTEIKYLGDLKIMNGKEFKILTLAFEWGPNKHTSGNIIIYTKDNEYFGRYLLGDATDLPNKLMNGSLFFDNTDNDSCDKNLVTVINLKKSLPKEIFIKCKGSFGDIYSLTIGRDN